MGGDRDRERRRERQHYLQDGGGEKEGGCCTVKNTSRENTHSEDGRSHNPSTSPDFKALHLSVQCFYFVSKNEALTVVNALWVMNKNTPELQI